MNGWKKLDRQRWRGAAGCGGDAKELGMDRKHEGYVTYVMNAQGPTEQKF